MVISNMGTSLMEMMGNYITRASGAAQILSAKDASNMINSVIVDYALVMLVILGVALISGIAANVVQFGFLFSTKALGFKMSKLNPLKGIKRIFSFQTLFDLVKNIVKTIIIGIIVYGEIAGQTDKFPLMMTSGISTSIVFLGDIVFNTMFKIAVCLLIIAAFDYIYQWFKYEKELRMSKYEVKMEYKQQEGDPLIKGHIKQKQRQMAMMRMMQDVPDADVVITNPTHYAVALRYEAEKAPAPKVTAKGKDLVAQRIKEIAKEHQIKIIENKPLAQGLYAYCQVGDMIPADMYQAVAEILAQIYREKKGNNSL